MKTNIQFRSYLVQFFLEWEMFQIQSAEKMKKCFTFNNLISKNVPFMRYVEKYIRGGQVTDGCMAHTHWKLDTWGKRHTHRIRNTNCVSNAIMAGRKHLNVTSYVHWISRCRCPRLTKYDHKCIEGIHGSRDILYVAQGLWNALSGGHFCVGSSLTLHNCRRK